MRSHFARRGTLLVAIAAPLLGSSLLAQDEPLDPAWVKQDVEWARYDKFLITPLDVSDVKLVRPPWAQDDPGDWSIADENLQLIQSIYRDTMKDTLEADGGYDVVHAAGKGVLQVEVELLSIMPYVRPGERETAQGQPYITLGSGEVNAKAEFRDSRTRELLMLLEGEKAVGREYKEHTDSNIVANLEFLFGNFAARVRNAMDRVHSR